MARIINSPGVQITEKDLSLRIEAPVGTNVVVPGFAPQGPVAEPLFITTTSELEQIYGIPTTPAEKYFYYTCKEVLNSPAVLTTVRLPYGLSAGNAFANAYSGLFYPLLSAATSTGAVSGWEIGAPVYKSLDAVEYNKLKTGNFDWTTTGGVSADVSDLDNIKAGFFILNDLQTVVNEIGEGYYVGFADNSSVGAVSSDFNSILEIKTLSSLGANFSTITTNRVDFALSSTQAESNKGVTSISESLEKVGFVSFETDAYQDHLSLGVFRIRRSTNDANLLSLATTEKYLGSFDSSRKQVSPSGGILQNSFIEDDINTNSSTIKMYINPEVSKNFDWTKNSTLPTSRITVGTQAKKLFPLGVYAPDTRATDQTKIIGNVPVKLDKVLRSLEIIENSTVDVIVDAGLSTIYSMTEDSSSNAFDDEKYVSDVDSLKNDWRSVTNAFINFCENTRKDCVTILDAPRPIFVSGKDTKVIDEEGKSFTLDIYNPLKDFASLESNYTAMYGNWVKIQDLYSGRRMWAPFSGYAAAVFARNDAAANTWAAPAGFNRGTFNVLDIAFNPNQKQRDRLYEISVNPVVFFTGEGFVVMGQKTLQGKPTAFDRINVRRLFLTLERAVQRTLKYFVFEPNTDFTRNRVRNVITPIFEFAKNTEGLYDYLIVCDERNNTPDSIDRNELIVDIYLKPVRTAEFILVNFIATRTGQNFQELI
jgi:hypothetical protein